MIKLSKSCIQCNLYISSFFFLVSMNAKTAESGLNTFSATVQLKMLFLFSFVPPVSSRISYYVTNSLHLNGNNISKVGKTLQKGKKHSENRGRHWSSSSFFPFHSMLFKSLLNKLYKKWYSVITLASQY